MGQVRIVSDGTVLGTVITDVATGESIDFVTKVTWTLGVDDEPATAVLEVELAGVDVVGDGPIPHLDVVQPA